MVRELQHTADMATENEDRKAEKVRLFGCPHRISHRPGDQIQADGEAVMAAAADELTVKTPVRKLRNEET